MYSAHDDDDVTTIISCSFIHSFIVYNDVTTIILCIIISAYDDVMTISCIIIIVYSAYDDVTTISCSSFIHSFIISARATT